MEDKLEQVSSTGSVRKNGGKPKISHLDPLFILGMAEVLTKSEEKYPPKNWTKGNNISVPFDSAMRHLMEFMLNEDNDKETKLNHLLHAGVNIMFIYYYYKNFPEMDDRTFSKK